MKPVTMGEIAARAGVHRTTVSMALRNHPKLPEATRQRIQALAREMGYVPNPMVSALMRFRAGRKIPQAQGEIAFLTHGSSEDLWRSSRAHGKMFAGARQRAAELGFRLEPLWLGRPGLNAPTLARRLHLRGIQAVIVAPLIGASRDLGWIDWGPLSAVALGYGLRTPGLHRISHDYFHGMVTAVENGLRLGYQRLGLILTGMSDKLVDHLWRGAWTVLREHHPDRLLPPLILSSPFLDAGSEIIPYLRHYRPDAVCALPKVSAAFHEHEPKADLPVWISLGCYEPDGTEMGIYQNHERIGGVAVEQVTRALYSSERGIPAQGHDTLVRGVWVGP